MYQFWYDYIKENDGNKAKLHYIGADSFIIYEKNLFKDIKNDVKKILGNCNYQVKKTLPTDKNKKVLGMRKDELGGAAMKEIVGLHPKMYSCLVCDDKKKD